MKKINGKVITQLIAFLSVLILFAIPASASIWEGIWGDKNEGTVEFLKKYEEYLSYGSFLSVIGHTMGWWFVKGLFFLTSGLEGLIPKSLDLLSFLENTGVSSLTTAIINDLVVTLMVLAIVFLGLKTIIAKEPPNFKSVGVNIFISAFLILGLPTLMKTMENIATEFYSASQTGNNNGEVNSLAWGLIQDNTADLLYISTVGFSTLQNDTAVKNSLTPDTLKLANLNALITPDTISEVDDNEIKHLAYRLDTDETGQLISDKIEGGAFSIFTDAFEEGYFRYQVKFLPIILGLTALLVAYLFTLFVFVTTIIEIGFKKIVGLFIFATDLESGQRTKMVVVDIMNAFLLIAFTGLSLKIFTLFLNYLATQSINPIIYIVAIVSSTFVLIKGSSTIMRYFGVDVGLKEGIGQLAAAFAVGRGTAGELKKLKRGSKSDGGSSDNDGIDDGKEALSQQSGTQKKSVNDSAAKGVSMRNGIGNLAKSGINALRGDTQSMKDSTDSLAMASVAGATAGIAQQSDKQRLTIAEDQQATSSVGDRAENNTAAAMNSRTGASESSRQDTNSQSNEEILANMKLNDATINTASGEIEMKEKLTKAPIEQGQAETAATMQTKAEQPNLQNSSTTADVSFKASNSVAPSVPPTAEQSIKQSTQQAASPSLGEQRQQVIQDVQQAGNTAAQQVTQNVVKAPVSAPETITQQVQQVMATAKLPTDVQDSVQKVIQEVRSSGSATSDTVKQKVIQELTAADFKQKEPLKQLVIQEVERAFSSEPEKQVEQQIIQKAEKSSVLDGLKFQMNPKTSAPSRFEQFKKK